MPRLRVHCFSISLDGYGAGVDQSLEWPLGRGGEGLHHWAFATRSFRRMVGEEGGSTGTDDRVMIEGFDNVGAWILGRNMFGPIRGGWGDEDWKGWWGTNPPYHVPTFVLTNYRREPIEMEGGTVFHFVTGGIEEAWERAREAAGEKDVRVGGGVSTIRQYLKAGLIHLMHIVKVPLLLGRGEHLLGGLELPALGYSARRSEPGDGVIHVWIEKDRAAG